MIEIIDNPIAHHNLSIMRDRNTTTEQFRQAVSKISSVLAVEVSKMLQSEPVVVDTPMERTTGLKFSEKPVLAPVLRAGMGMLDGFLYYYPDADIAMIGMKRNETSFEAENYLFSLPTIKPEQTIILLDIMLATGGSASAVISRLQLEGIENIIFASIVAVPEGIERIKTNFPNVRIITASLDRELNEMKYIMPGLGDAGDRYFGTI